MKATSVRSRAYAFGSIGMAAAAVVTGGIIYLASSTATTTVAATATAAADPYNVDGNHSFVVFRVKHNQVSYAYGRFNEISGTFAIGADNPSASDFDFEVKTASVDTGLQKRDDHIRSPDFLNAQQFPVIRFKGNQLESNGEKQYKLSGDLSLHGQTKPITADLVHVGEMKGGRDQLSGFEATFTIKRSDFGMDYMVGPLGDEIRITVSVEGRRPL